MSWTDITDEGRVYSMAHLQPFAHMLRVEDVDITIHFAFGLHCFTDEKGNGKLIFNRGERRNFSPTRYYALFFQITKPNNSVNQLKILIISAYPLDQWGRSNMPRGQNHKLSWVLSQRAKGIAL